MDENSGNDVLLVSRAGREEACCSHLDLPGLGHAAPALVVVADLLDPNVVVPLDEGLGSEVLALKEEGNKLEKRNT